MCYSVYQFSFADFHFVNVVSWCERSIVRQLPWQEEREGEGGGGGGSFFFLACPFHIFKGFLAEQQL